MKYKEVIKSDRIDEYVRYHKKFFNEVVSINADIFLLEKISSFPFYQLGLYDDRVFYNDIYRNTFQILVIKVFRLIKDQDPDVYTITKFRNDIRKSFLIEDFKPLLDERLKKCELNDKSYDNLSEKVKRVRNEFLAHKNLKYFKNDYDEIFLKYDEIKKLVFRINDFFKALSFDVEDAYEKDYYFNVDIRESTINYYNDIIDQSMQPLIMNSDYVSKENFWDLKIEDLSEEEKLLLESFKKKASSLKLGFGQD